MTPTETVERLTDIIARQARIIRELHNVVEQLKAATSLTQEVEAILADAKQYEKSPEQKPSGFFTNAERG
ncbi:MAG: hypothetical protein LBU13_09450 [Synergistaceae bacterium]|nr:hypothetical protein [Synergistaceae bacterium]